MSKKVSRRSFLSGIAMAAAAPCVIPASALGLNGKTPPSERIVMGGIGIRNRGMHDLRWMTAKDDVQFVAICDVWKKQRQVVKQWVDDFYGNKDCETYRDIREFLPARPDIDAVLIATGDRWHAQASIRAMKAGMDVYCEKPSSMTIEEGQILVETARRFGRVFQTGVQRLSEAPHVFCIEKARRGLMGHVHTAYAHIWRKDNKLKHHWLPAQDEPPKDVVDWDVWLGPCPWRPFNMRYVHGGWRGFYDLHATGIAGWGAHTFAQAQAGLDKLDTSPVKYEYPKNDSGNGMVCRFPDGQKIVLLRGALPTQDGTPSEDYWHGACGERFDSEQGWVAAADGYSRAEASSPQLLQNYERVVGEYVARTGRALDHMRDFLDCVKSREQPVANPEVMHRSMTSVHCANICLWLERDLEYDPEKEEFVNDAEANRLRSRAMREPWTV